MLLPTDIADITEELSARICEICGPRPYRNLHGCPLNQSFEVVNFPPDSLQFFVVVCSERFIPFLLELFDLSLHRSFIDASYTVMSVHLYVEDLAKSRQKLTLVHLGMALDSFMFDAIGNLSQFCQGLLLKLSI